MATAVLAYPTRALQGTNQGSGLAMEESENDVGSLEQLLLYADEHYLNGKLPLRDHLGKVLHGVEEYHQRNVGPCMERAPGFKICFCKVSEIATPTSARIVERVTVGSKSNCRTILLSSLLVVFLVAPDPVFCAWVPSRVHCSQQFLTPHSERSTWPATRCVDQPAVFIPMIRHLSNSLNGEKCLLARLPGMFRLPKSSYNRRVCFNDESTFEIVKNKAQFVRRPRGEQFHSDCVVQTVKHPTKIMIRSVISGKDTGRLYEAKDVGGNDGPTALIDPPRYTIARYDRRIVRIAVMDLAGTSRKITQQIQSVAHHSVTAHTIRHRLQQVECLQDVHCFAYPLLEITGVCSTNGAMNDGHGQRNGTKLCLLVNLTSPCNITMVGFEFGDTVVRGC
ncbi:uncharacterized protein TNCV_986081 [Trichonephila clavipes]|uniref:Uncharacterized protein n=1 Tax=Trichonephila clavipes TaxID=2585209 RepID=A0A8X6SSX7_TRICX|nr:uncharacterized protein TNCV_986081 [Trichonephila clavipes]